MKKYSLPLFVLFIVSSCTHTKLVQTWSDPDNKVVYNDILVVGISDSEQTRRAYETYFVASFEAKGVEALASYTIISHKGEMELDGEKKSFESIIEKAVKGSDIDAALVTHLVNVEQNEINRPSIVYTPSYDPEYYSATYYSDMYGYHTYVAGYVQQPGYITEEDTYVLESSLYDVKTEELVWTTRSKTFAPDSIDQAIKDVSDLIISDLEERRLISTKK